MTPVIRRFPVSRRSLLTWVIALIAGVLAALAARQHLNQKVRQLEADAAVPMVSRIVAAFDLPAGTRLEPVHLATRNYPGALVSSDTLAPDHFQSLLGQQLRSSLKGGDLIVPAHARQTGQIPFSSQLGPGRRAITMPVDAINAVAGLLKPGDLIDLYVSFDYQRRRVTAPLLQGVLVLATGLNTALTLEEAAAAGSSVAGGYATVTLDTSPEDAVKLVAARQGGVITSVLRRPDDDEATRKAVRGDLASLLGVARPPPERMSRRAPVIYGSSAKVALPRLVPAVPGPRQDSGVFELPRVPGLVSRQGGTDAVLADTRSGVYVDEFTESQLTDEESQ